VAVHPEDERYSGLVGERAILPFLGRALPIIADPAVERDFGTGAVKITPAHDPEDYALAQRHGLTAINVLSDEAHINEAGGEFVGLDRYEARDRIVGRLRAMGDLEAERPHQMSVGRCDRCGTVSEPRLSVQWFIRVKPLAERALASVTEGRTEVVPSRFVKVYTHWMETIHDWAVGRQLWWGHRIPAWFCPDGHITVTDAADGPDACAECGRSASELTQETDIFDTWFSSGLWPFSTLGWPDRTPDFERFYPTTVMETAYDILFFWVARMMMLGLFCTGVEPFRTVYLSGLIRVDGGAKMSKTKGNVVDPLGMIDEIGADALRFALVIGTSPGNDQRLTDSKLEGARNFTNKLWNAARFVLGARPEPLAQPSGDRTLAERWIRSRLADATERGTRQLDALDLGGYAATVHEFAWSEFADWFLEMAKVELRREDVSAGDRARVWASAAQVLADLLRLAHPIMPFVTEEIWDALGSVVPGATGSRQLLITAAWPRVELREPAVEDEMAALMELVRTVRNLRTESGAPAGAWLPLAIAPSDASAAAAIERGRGYIEPLARVRPIQVASPDERSPAVAASPLGAAWFPVPEAGDPAQRHHAQRKELEGGIERLRALLANPAFTSKAPAEVVARERARLAELEERLGQLGAG
jgi:valyl-tRNA synthetase